MSNLYIDPLPVKLTNPGVSVKGSTTSTDTNGHSLLAAAGAGLKNYISSMQFGRNDAGTGVIVVTLNDSASTKIIVPPGGGSANRNNAIDPRIAGSSSLASNNTFRIDVPNGTYDIRYGLIGSGVLTRYYCKIKYGAGSVEGTDQLTIDSGSANVNNTNILDANAGVWSPANWPGSNVTKRITVTQGFITIGLSSAPSAISHFAYQEVVTPLADGVLHDDTDAAVTPKLMEAQPFNKVLGYLSFSVGSDTDIDYSITQSDGVTPDTYLSLRTINGKKAICYKNVRHHGTGPTRTFYVTQTDKVPGKHANAPYIQAVTLDVVAAATKPWGDGTLFAKVSTGAWLARKKVIDKLSAAYNGASPGTSGLWPGYQGQSFYQTTTCYTNAAVLTAINSMKASAGSGRWFCIEIDQDGTSDWTTGQVAANGNANGDWLFKPEDGGGLLIRYKASGAKPMLKGIFYPRCPRGVHIDGLTIANDGSVNAGAGACIRFDSGVGAGGEFALLKVSNNKLGFLHDPAYSGTTPETMDTSKAMCGVLMPGQCEQFIAVNNVVYGCSDALQVTGRYVHIEGNEVAYCIGDNHAMAQPNPATTQYADKDQYVWIKGNTYRATNNVNSAYHSDWYQLRTHNYHDTGICYVLAEENIVHKSYDATGISGSTTQISDDATLTTCFINNIFSGEAPRGVDLAYGSGIISYAEYNSFGPCTKLIANSTQYAQQGIQSAGGGATWMDRKNILTFSSFISEDETFYAGKVADAKDPNAVMNGPFIQDPSYPTLPRYISQIVDDPLAGVTNDQFKAAMIAAFTPKSGVDAGYFSGTAVAAGHRNFLTMGVG